MINRFFLLLICFLPIASSLAKKGDPSVLNTLKEQKTLKTKTFSSLSKTATPDFFTERRAFQSEFTQAYIDEHYSEDSLTTEDLGQAMAVMRDLDSTQNYVGLIGTQDLVTLPVGVKKQIGNLTYIMGISEALFGTEYTSVTAFVKITIPQLDENGNQKELFFGAHDIKISHQGGIYGDANLTLLGDVSIPINGGKAMVVLNGGLDLETGVLDNKTFVSVDCEGFKQMRVSMDILFSRTLLEPLDTNLEVITNTNAKVTGHFETVITDWNDILATVSLPAFQIAKNDSNDSSGKAGMAFELNTAVFDFSDSQNDPDMLFPDGYDQYLIPGNREAWRGVYIKSLLVILPEQFQKKDSESRVSFQASDLLIDGMGVSGTFAVNNILPITEGDASKWQFSVDQLQATFVTNHLTAAGFKGRVVLPITEAVTESEANSTDTTTLMAKSLTYSAIIDPNNDAYTLSVSTNSDLNFDVFQAEATLTPNSYIELTVSDKKFKPKAVLHGNLKISGSNSSDDPSKKTVNFEGIVFEKLQLQSESPYLQVDYFGYQGAVELANFPVTISEIGITANDREVSLHFGIDVNLMGDSGFGGGTSLSINGAMEESDGRTRWQFQGIDINRISIAADMGAIQLSGSILIRNDDPVYGDGFYGEIEAVFNGITVTASACFGKTDFRYWYVDAYVDLSQSPVQITIGPVIVGGFGGGAYYRMKKGGGYSSGIPSGQSYVPDADSGIGFRALIGFALGNDKAFNGKVGFEMAFNTSGGLNRIAFFGEAHIVKALDFGFGDQFKDKMAAMEEKASALEDNAVMNTLKEANLVEYSKEAFPQDGLTLDIGIDANFSMEMDFQNKTFHAEMEVFVNTPGGVLQGIGPKGRAGWATFHAGQGEWYLYMGTPDDRVGIKMGLGNFKIETTSYLMIGTNIKGSPPPPNIIAEILGLELAELDYMRDLNALGDGAGFAFGMSLSIDTGNIQMLVFYARYQMGMGFDIMLKDYGTAACEGSGNIGISGWYANGQAYAYMQGELGINVNLMFVQKKIPILEAGAAMLLQAKLPNPSWFRGYMGGYYSVLGGSVQGDFRFKFELGEECELVNGGALAGIKVIANISPEEGQSDIDVFAKPQVAFNMAINKPFELEDDEGVKTYRILLEEFTVNNEEEPLIGDLEWNDRQDKVSFVSYDILPAETALTVKAIVSFQEYKNDNWIVLNQEDGTAAEELETRLFTTGDAPDYIPEENILYAYPVIDQKYFYKDERSTGYIKLERGQPELFQPQTDWKQKIHLSSSEAMTTSTQITYDGSNRIVNFDLPSMANAQEYIFSMVSYPPALAGSENEIYTYVAQETGVEGNTIETKDNQSELTGNDDVLVEMLAYAFKTSAHNTFADKIAAKQVTQYYLEPIYFDVHALQIDVASSERFSVEEIEGNAATQYEPLIEVEAMMTDAYYKNTIYPLLYEDYPINASFTIERASGVNVGIPPTQAVEPVTWYTTYLENFPSFSLLDRRIPYRYNLPYYYKQDFKYIQNVLLNEHIGNLSENTALLNEYQQNFILGSFPAIRSGDYQVKMQYMLPGGIEGSSAILTYNNPY